MGAEDLEEFRERGKRAGRRGGCCVRASIIVLGIINAVNMEVENG